LQYISKSNSSLLYKLWGERNSNSSNRSCISYSISSISYNSSRRSRVAESDLMHTATALIPFSNLSPASLTIETIVSNMTVDIGTSPSDVVIDKSMYVKGTRKEEKRQQVATAAAEVYTIFPPSFVKIN
jgi:hypothetical protein